MSEQVRKPRPTTSPVRRRDQNETPYRDSPNRPSGGIEAGGYYTDAPASPFSPTRSHRYHDSLQSNEYDPATMGASRELGRKRSLIRPERNRIDQDHPNYYYRQHARNMEVLPSTTGDDPIVEETGDIELLRPTNVEGANLSRNGTEDTIIDNPGFPRDMAKAEPIDRKATRTHRKLTRREAKQLTEEEKMRQKELDKIRPPSIWNVYCAIVTFWCPDFVLSCFGKIAKAQRRAWREKMGLLSIIIFICAFVGFITFGFSQAVCGTPGVRLKINHVDNGYLIVHGQAYDLSRSAHPAAIGVPLDTNVLYDLPHKYGGQDATFMFQYVNGACKDLITRTNESDIPTNSNGDLAWYFPCHAFNQDGSSKPNFTEPYYAGYACHTSEKARKTLYSLRTSGEVYFTWNDVKNKSRNLIVYSGNVLDLDLLAWFNTSAVQYPTQFDDLRKNNAIRGLDVTHAFQSGADKKIAQCLSETIKVGSIDTDTVGCIASKVVLYVSLIFILSIVVSKFILAIAFHWFISSKYDVKRGGKSTSKKRRNQQIEEWSDDIYRPAPKITEPGSTVAGDRTSKRASHLFPHTSRFTSPYAVERPPKDNRPMPTTMVSQNSTARLLQSDSAYKHRYSTSQGTLLDPSSAVPGGRPVSYAASRSSLPLSGSNEQPYSNVTSEGDVSTGPQGYIHEAVVPQPPPEWQPYGFPLAHVICLVTAYSEGADGIRTTLDSIATTDYPNSHKTILVICDGMIKGKGEALSTPEIVVSMMGDHAILPEDVEAFSYVAVASGTKRHNMAKVYAGFYDYGDDSVIPPEKQQRVPMMVVVKCGTPDEEGKSKPGNRGKRDSQIILMSFLQKVMFDERMTELEFEIFNGLWKVTGMSPDFYEMVLMVDADTKVFPDSLTNMVGPMVRDPEIMGLCGETKIANKRASWVSMIQVFEYFISHHQAKAFESVFGGVTCLPGCFCMYRIKAPKGGQNYWVPILANPDVVEHYSENVVDTLHKKNLYLLGEDRYLSTLMLKTFPKRKQVFVPQAVCKTTVPEEFSVLLSQRRRWINSTVHNLMELILVRDLCGTFCFSMQFVVFMELVGTVVLPAAIAFTFYVVVISIVRKPVQIIPLVLLALILGLPAILIVCTAHRWSYVLWMFVYLLSLPIWNFVLPTYAYWKFDDFSWGDTRKTAGEKTKKAGIEYEGEFDSSKITMKRWGDFEKERRNKASTTGGWSRQSDTTGYSVQGGYEQYHDY